MDGAPFCLNVVTGSSPKMSTTHQIASKAQLSLVAPEETGGENAGNALVVGPFPPLIGPASGHASALLHMFKDAGYSVRSATGPGLALARHNLNFGSETRLRNSSAFLSDCDGDDFAVVYAKSFDFGKVVKPLWYKRRLEEIRRLRLLMRIVRTYRSTSIVLDAKPLRSRYQLSLWAVGRLTGLLSRRSVKVIRQGEEARHVFARLIGLRRPAPTAYAAEDTAYDAAFNPNGPTRMVRLTVARAEQALNFWTGRGEDRTNSKTAKDLRALIDLSQRHDFNRLPHFRLLWDTPKVPNIGSAQDAGRTDFPVANDLLDLNSTFGVPITRYMQHLWVSLGPNRRFRINSRKDAETILKWYLFEAPGTVPAQSVPICRQVREYYLDQLAGGMLDFDIEVGDVIHARGRDANPFALSATLAALANSDHPIAARYNIDDPLDRLGFVLEFLLTKRGSDHEIGKAAEAYLTAPIGGDPQNVSRLGFLLALQARCQLDSRTSIEAPWSDKALSPFLREHCAVVFPAIGAMMKSSKMSVAPDRQFALSGLPKSETGVGSNLHMSLSALREVGFEPKVYDTADGMRPLDVERTQMRVRKLKKSVALHHVNADQIPQSLLTPAFQSRKDR